MKTKLIYPDWVVKHKQKGTQIVKVKDKYYLYKIKSVWDPKKGRARKITEKYLGRITEEGLIKPKHQRVLDELEQITVKEFGATSLLLSLCEDIPQLLKQHFPLYWKELFVFSVARLFHHSPLKNILDHYTQSHLSDVFSGAKVSSKSLSKILLDVGSKRGNVVEFLRNFVRQKQYQIIDVTQVFSYSEDVISATLGYNSHNEYVPQVNFVMIFGLEEKEPSFFRVVSGSIRDVTVLKTTLEEAAIKEAVLIGDKGFHSQSNVEYLEQNGLRYIIPLKRNNTSIDYAPLLSGKRRDFDGYFSYEGRPIWHKEKIVEGRRVILFFDESLKTEEEKDFIGHVSGGKLSIDKFYDIEHRFGSIAVVTNTGFEASRVYELLKGRVQIEQSFDTFKNLLHSDRSYIRQDASMNGWMFVNFISLLLYYRLYMKLQKYGLLKKYSVNDLIIHLSRVNKLKLHDRWTLSEVPKTTKTLLNKLNFELHIA